MLLLGDSSGLFGSSRARVFFLNHMCGTAHHGDDASIYNLGNHMSSP